MENLTEYLNTSVENLVRSAWRSTLSNPKESAFLTRMLAVQKSAAKKRSESEKAGLHMPPFLIASIATRCNLHCAGCYARANRSCRDEPDARELSAEEWKRIFREASESGVSFVLLAGGEPLLRGDVLRSAAETPNVIFPVFTNGTMIDGPRLEWFDAARNVIPVLSLEGGESSTDARRGAGTFRRLENLMDRLREKGIFYGCSITVTRENQKEVTDGGFVGHLGEKGCRLIFFVEYVPVQAGTENLAPADTDRCFLADRLEMLRARYRSVVFLSFPGDEKALGGCLAAGRGFFHINALGGAEPCPFSPYSDVSLKNRALADALRSPLFGGIQGKGLNDIPHDGGCALFQHRDSVLGILEAQGRE